MFEHRAPRIAIFGPSLMSAYRNPDASYYRGMLRCLSELGYNITFYEPEAFDRQDHHDINPPAWATVKTYKDEKDSVDDALKGASSAEILIKASNIGVWDDYLREKLLECNARDKMVMLWEMEAPIRLTALKDDKQDPLHKQIAEFDAIVMSSGGDHAQKAFTEYGSKAAHVVYPAADTSIFEPEDGHERFASMLAYIGDSKPDRDPRTLVYLNEIARQLPEKRLLIGGEGWQDTPLPDNVDAFGHVYTGDLNLLYNSARAVLVLNRKPMVDWGYAPSTRLFEAAAAGAAIITEPMGGLDEFFTPFKELLTANDGTEAASKLLALSPDKATELGRNAREYVLANHTYEDRARHMDRIIRDTFERKQPEKVRTQANHRM